MRHIVTIVAAVLAGWLAEQSLLAAPPARPAVNEARPLDAGELRDLLAQLDDESYVRRERATERLHAAGEQAIDVLAQGALSGSPEAAWRAGEALKRIAITGNERTIDQVATALERVGKQGRAGMTTVVAEIRARQKQIRHDRAAAQIRQLGGGLAGGIAGMDSGMVLEMGFLPVPMAAIEIAEAEVVTIELPTVEEEPAKEEPAKKEPVKEDPPPKEDAPAKVEAPLKEAADAAPAKVEPPSKAAADATLPDKLAEGLDLDAWDLRDVSELSLKHGKGQRVEEGGIDEFRRLERLPLGDAESAEEMAPAIVAAADIEVDFAIAMPAGAIFIGGGFGDMGIEEGVAAESLSLDANWRGGDKGLEVLRDLPDVTSINIHGAKLTDAGLAHIAALPKLSSISIRGTKFSVAALRELHAARPKAYLFCQGEAMVGIHADTTGSCVLTSVYGGSGAADAGLREGDRIVAIDDVEIRDFSELTISVYGHGVGEKLKIEYEREGKRQTAQVELKARAVLEP